MSDPIDQEWLNFYSAGLDFVPQIAREPRLDLLRAYFEARTAFWPHPIVHAEWHTSGNFDTLKLEPPVAFHLIPAAVSLLLEQKELNQITNAGYLLLVILEMSGATEMPPFLDGQWDAIMDTLELAAGPGRDKPSNMAATIREWLELRYRRQAGLDLVPEIIRSPERPDLLRAYLEARMVFLNYPFFTHVRYSGNFESLLSDLEPRVAFQLIPTATALLLEQTGPERIAKAGWLLSDIARKSDATEMPPFLNENWPAVLALLQSATGDEKHGRGAKIARDTLARWYSGQGQD